MTPTDLGLRSATGKHIPIHQSELAFGRGPQNDVVINDANVSRRHALLKASAGRLVLQDAGSANGTYVNGHRLNQPTPLRAGDVVTIGPERFVVEVQAARSPAAPAAPMVPYTPVLPGRRSRVVRGVLVPLMALGALFLMMGLATTLFISRPLQPDEAARAWVGALAAQDVHQLSDFTCMAQQNSIQATSLVVGAGGLLGTSLDVGSLQYTTTRTSGDQADVRVTGSVVASFGPLSTGRRLDLTIRMRQEDGKWRYCDDLQRIASQFR